MTSMKRYKKDKLFIAHLKKLRGLRINKKRQTDDKKQI